MEIFSSLVEQQTALIHGAAREVLLALLDPIERVRVFCSRISLHSIPSLRGLCEHEQLTSVHSFSAHASRQRAASGIRLIRCSLQR